MFDFVSQPESQTAAPVLFLSGPFGVPREWDGIADCLGTRGVCQAFKDRGGWLCALENALYGAHLVAHGTAVYDALRVVLDNPERVRSATLVDPDIITALPELSACLQFRRHTEMISRATDFFTQGDCEHAAEEAVDWWMGHGAWRRTSHRIQTRFDASVVTLANDWQRQMGSPFDLLELANISAPVRIVTGRKSPADIRAMARLMKMVIPRSTTTLVKAAGSASHLTDPHVVGPDVSNFIVSCDMDWHHRHCLAAAA